MQIKDIIEKLSSYNLFNYLFPGCVFAIILGKTTDFMKTTLEFDLVNVIMIYLIGNIISRIGSLVVEEVLKKFIDIGRINTKILFAAFKDNFKLEVIHETMNMYRSLAACFMLLFCLTVIDLVVNHQSITNSLIYLFTEALVFIIFVFAFIKMRGKVIECL